MPYSVGEVWFVLYVENVSLRKEGLDQTLTRPLTVLLSKIAV